jgi:hypothetical protein
MRDAPQPGDTTTHPVLLFLASAISATWMFSAVLLHGL